MSLSTHVLDASTGRPAVGVAVSLRSFDAGDWFSAGSGVTDGDGRIKDLGSPGSGRHQLTFDTGAYFDGRGVATFYPEVSIVFEVVDARAHHHVPLLLSPYAYSTYRGS